MATSTATRTPQVGDRALVHGRLLEIGSIDEEKNLANIWDPSAHAMKGTLIEEFKALRAEQQAMSIPEGGKALAPEDLVRHAEIHAEITRKSEELTRASFKIGLRMDLLTWWEAKSVWVSDGRLLSDAQLAAYAKATGVQLGKDGSWPGATKPVGAGQRAALSYLIGEGLTPDPFATEG